MCHDLPSSGPSEFILQYFLYVSSCQKHWNPLSLLWWTECSIVRRGHRQNAYVHISCTMFNSAFLANLEAYLLLFVWPNSFKTVCFKVNCKLAFWAANAFQWRQNVKVAKITSLLVHHFQNTFILIAALQNVWGTKALLNTQKQREILMFLNYLCTCEPTKYCVLTSKD